MKRILFIVLIMSNFSYAQRNTLDTVKIRADLEKVISDLETNYVYYQQKDVDLACLKSYYRKRISRLKNKTELLLLYEYLLNEFYDSHLHLNTNSQYSYRLYSPIYAATVENKTTLSSYWKDQIENDLNLDFIGAEILSLNGVEFQLAIDNFPTHCQNKNNDEIRTWISNKLLAGRYNEPRIIRLKTKAGTIVTVDLDTIKLKKETTLVSHSIKEGIGIIRINNSLGTTGTKKEFKKALQKVKHTKGIILDLRNTVDGGNTSVANPIAGHFTKKKQSFQSYKNKETQFIDYIKPTCPNFDKPVVVLVGRWTGSMGEGLASGLDGAGMAKIVGTEMQKLAGATKNYSFSHNNFGYQIPYIEVLHITGFPREDFVPKYKIVSDTSSTDEFIQEGIKLIMATK